MCVCVCACVCECVCVCVCVCALLCSCALALAGPLRLLPLCCAASEPARDVWGCLGRVPEFQRVLCAGPGGQAYTCLECKTKRSIEHVAMPFIFHYLATELAAMNIKCNLSLRTSLD